MSGVARKTALSCVVLACWSTTSALAQTVPLSNPLRPAPAVSPVVLNSATSGNQIVGGLKYPATQVKQIDYSDYETYGTSVVSDASSATNPSSGQSELPAINSKPIGQSAVDSMA